MGGSPAIASKHAAADAKPQVCCFRRIDNAPASQQCAAGGDMPAMSTASPLSLPVDLSRLPPMQLVTVDHGLERDKIIAGVQARMKAWGFDFDVGRLASDPSVALIEEVAYR
ncbi:MAG: hypothetical protein ACREEJ_07930, partial [Ensifer adhaerens]